MKLKVMTFNTQHCLNYYTRAIDFDLMADAINKVNPDIVGLEEMRNKGLSESYDDQVAILAKLTGMNGVFGEAIKFNGVNPYGVGLLSKYPIIESEATKIPDPNPPKYNGYYETRCVLRTKIALPEGEPLNVFVSHFGLNPDEAENAVETVKNVVYDKRSVFMGDLNMTPDNPTMQPLFDKFYDTKLSAKVPGQLFTFESPNPYCKIDYVFTTKEIEVNDAYVPEIIASDHRPFVAEIEA